MKKTITVISLMLCFILSVSLTGCKKNKKEKPKNTTSSLTSSTSKTELKTESETQTPTVSPEEFVENWIIATNKPDANYIDGNTLFSGEEFYKKLAEMNNTDVSEYYKTQSGGKATDYKSFMEYNNSLRLNYFTSTFGTADVKTTVKSLKSEPLDENCLNLIKETFLDFDYLDPSAIKSPILVTANYTLTGGNTSQDFTEYYIIVDYKGNYKYFVHTDDLDTLNDTINTTK